MHRRFQVLRGVVNTQGVKSSIIWWFLPLPPARSLVKLNCYIDVSRIVPSQCLKNLIDLWLPLQRLSLSVAMANLVE